MVHFVDFIQLLKNDRLKDFQDSYQAFSLIADGKASHSEIKEFLILINEKGVDVHLLSGAAKALSERSIKIKAPKGAIDVCGTGGDNSNSLNISTTVAFILASMGVTVAKHGNKAVSSKSGSADIFSELGIDLNQSQSQIEASLETNNLAFIFAPLYHPALKNVAAARQEIGQEMKSRTIFNFLGPLINPAEVKRQLIGCSNLEINKMMAQTCIDLGLEKCFVVTGMDGMDEISISANSLVNKVENGKLSLEILDPEKFNIKKREASLIQGGDAKYNAKKLVELLKNEIFDEKMQAYKDIVSLNSAGALIVVGKFDNLNEAILAVKEQIESKKAYNFLKKFTNQ